MVIGMEHFTKKYLSGPEGAHRRAIYKSMGFTDLDLSKPLVAVVNSWGEVCPGHFHLNMVAQKVKEGIWQAGATPLEFNTISQCGTLTLGLDGIRYDLATRDLVAFDIETVVNIQMFDGVVFIPTCDKVVPGMLMAAARLDLPSVFVPGGVMGVEEVDGNRFSLSDLDEMVMGALPAGKADVSQIAALEEIVCPTWGACPLMGTANTMQALAEALGMALPASSTLSATSSVLLRGAKKSGSTVVDLIRKDIRPHRIMTERAMRNMVITLMALGGSTNSIIHILALAEELGLGEKINLDAIDRISAKTPCLVNVKPNGPHYVTDFDKAGGIPQLMDDLRDILSLEVLTVTGKSLEENLKDRTKKRVDRNVIFPPEKPLSRDGGIVVLYGNVAPGGAILRQSARYRENLFHQGPARVFNSQEEALVALNSGNIKPGDVMVVRYEGPRGGPGMPDIYTVQATVVGMGLEKEVAVITDARFSGFARGFGVCQITPEAALGGPIALLEEGDEITIDVTERKLDVLDEKILKKRSKSWKPVRKEPRKGILGLYAKLGGPANKGARLE
jgi:dihydroxy-acid dehydratase